jgi:hypothetical protein
MPSPSVPASAENETDVHLFKRGGLFLRILNVSKLKIYVIIMKEEGKIAAPGDMKKEFEKIS